MLLQPPKRSAPSPPRLSLRLLPKLPCTGDHQELQKAMAPRSPDAGHSCTGSDEGAQGPEEESAVASKAAPATQSPHKNPLTRRASMLVEFLLEKYTEKEPISAEGRWQEV